MMLAAYFKDEQDGRCSAICIGAYEKSSTVRLSFCVCGLVTDFRTFYNDYLMVVKFFEWLKEKAEG